MNWQGIANDWSQYLPKVRRRWRALSEEQASAIQGDYDRLVLCLQESYRLSAEVAKDDVREWMATFGHEDLVDLEDTVRVGACSAPDTVAHLTLDAGYRDVVLLQFSGIGLQRLR